MLTPLQKTSGGESCSTYIQSRIQHFPATYTIVRVQRKKFSRDVLYDRIMDSHELKIFWKIRQTPVYRDASRTNKRLFVGHKSIHFLSSILPFSLFFGELGKNETKTSKGKFFLLEKFYIVEVDAKHIGVKGEVKNREFVRRAKRL